MDGKKSLRAYNMMYEQQMKYLPAKTMDNLIHIIEQKILPKRYACILHDKDMSKDGNPVEPHVHVMLEFDTARHFTAIAKKLGEIDDKGNSKTQQLQKWNDKVANGYSYLVHETKNALGKHHYSPDEVKANFDFNAELVKISTKTAIIKAKQETPVQMLLDALYEGSITKEEVEQRLSGRQYGRVRRELENVYAKRLQIQAKEWRMEMKKQGKILQVIWIWGKAGTGKTSLAKEYAKKKGHPYYISGSSRDVFQNYAGEHTLILDEFRPNIMPYSDLLRITDPHSICVEVLAPARYNDKALACDLIIITSPYDPYNFFLSQYGNRTEGEIDNFQQLKRRIAIAIEMTDTEILLTEYNRIYETYTPIPGTNRKNPYSSANRPMPAYNTLELYQSIFN